MKLILLLPLLVAGCAQVKWGGAHLGPAFTAPIGRVNKSAADSMNTELNLIWLLPRDWTMQAEIIQPMTGGEPLVRGAITKRIF